MTPKQRAFADAIIAGQSPSEAYRTAYNPRRMSAKSISVEAQKLMKNPAIALVVRQGVEAATSKATWSRQKAIERNQRLNDVAYAQLSEGDLDRDVFNAFVATDKRLDELCDLGYERHMRRRGIQNAIENRSPFAIGHKMEWSELQQLIKDADVDKEVE